MLEQAAHLAVWSFLTQNTALTRPPIRSLRVTIHDFDKGRVNP